MQTPTTQELPPIEPGTWRRGLTLVKIWSGTPSVPPPLASRLDRVFYGFAQPWLGLRVMLRSKELLGECLLPSVATAAWCLFLAAVSDPIEVRVTGSTTGLGGLVGVLLKAVALFYVLAPIPPFLFARHNARITARARNLMGFGPREPYLKSLGQLIVESIKIAVILAVGIAPITFVLSMFPVVGTLAAAVASAAWSLHWIVVEGFDNSRTLAPGETVVQRELDAHAMPHSAWFYRYPRQTTGLVHTLLLPLRVVTHVVAQLAREWSPELREVESKPWVSLGFGIGTAIILLVPIVNLLFRPALLIGGVHLRARLEHETWAPRPSGVDATGGSVR